jgi:hyperosmotically inducible periplasmic protein
MAEVDLNMKRIAITASLAFLMFGALGASAQEKKPNPDNTKVNKTASPTADNAGNSAADRELTQKIRKAVMDDKSLSTYAHNTKIIAKDGKVTLKGPVNSEDEKAAIERIANDTAGAGNVTNQITVKPALKKKKT